MVEINEEHINHLHNTFPQANIYHQDFLTFASPHPFDIILGNPPFNIQGLKKVPTNTTQNKKKDGKTAWTHFIRHSLSLLKKMGGLLMITPSIWMKTAKHEFYGKYPTWVQLMDSCLEDRRIIKIIPYR